MSLEFNKLIEQAQRMGRMIEALDFDEKRRLQLALERFEQVPDIHVVQERIDLIRQSGIRGYRGAAPLLNGQMEALNEIFAAPTAPSCATIIAVDGSQIYPDEQHPIHYYLLNTGVFIYHQGAERIPEPLTIPELFYHKAHIQDRGRVINNRTVDARRTVTEMFALAEMAEQRRDEARPIIALYDNRLLFWANENNVTGADELLRRYHAALEKLRGAGAFLAGYVNQPVSRLVMRLLYLLSLRDYDEIKENEERLPMAGDLSGLTDRRLFEAVLRPGERSTIMVQNSPQNRDYKERLGADYEIAFFYLRAANPFQSALVRVDIPLWVARNRAAVDSVHALLLEQCSMQGRNPYPYALTRADELARVSSQEKQRLDEMIRLELIHNGQFDAEVFSPKDWGKELARSVQRRHEL